MRINWTDEEERPGQFALWDANCRRSIKSSAGQRALRDLELALLSLPEKRLIHGSLVDEGGDVCAIAAYGKYKGLDLSKFDPEDESDEVGIAAGMPKLVAWKVVALNDITCDTVWEVADGPNAEGPIRYDEVGHAARWAAIEICADELDAVLAQAQEATHDRD